MTVVSRLELDHPPLGTTGGTALHAAIETLYTKIGDAISSRYFLVEDINDAASVDLDHNFNVNFSDLRFDLYLVNTVTGELTQKVTNSSSPSLSDITVIAKSGDEETQLTLTNNSGSQQDLVLILFHDPIYLSEGDVKDVDVVTAVPEDGQALVYEASSGKWKPGASGDSSFKLASISSSNLTLKGGYLPLTDGREVATFEDAGGALSTDHGNDITINLTNVGGSPANDTTYYLYLVLDQLVGPVTLTDNGRVVYQVTVANEAIQFLLSTTTPENIDRKAYRYLGGIHTANTGNSYSGTGSFFWTAGAKLSDHVFEQQGEINLVDSPSDARGWSTTGSGPSVTTTKNASDLPLSPVVKTAIQLTKTGNAAEATNYASPLTITMPEALKNTKLKVEIHPRPGTGYADNEWTVSVYAGATRIPLSTDSSGVTYIPNSNRKFTTYFESDGSSTYTLRFAKVAGAGTGTLNLARVIVGPGIQPQGAASGGLIDFTPVFNNVTLGTGGSVSGRYQRFGPVMHLEANLVLGTGGSITGPVTLNIPDSKTALVQAIGSFQAGVVSAYDSSNVAGRQTGSVIVSGGSPTTMLFAYSGSGGGQWNTSVPFTWAVNDSISVKAFIPITDWAGSGVNLAQNDVEYFFNTSTANASDTTSFGYGPQGVQFGNYTTNLAKTINVGAIQPSDFYLLEYTINSGATWIPVAGAGSHVESYQRRNAVSHGMGLQADSATTLLVQFASKRLGNATTYGGSDGSDWSAIAGSDVYRWRVRKIKGGAAIGFGLATPTETGLVRKNRWQKKTIGNIGGIGSGILSNFTFNNLTVGNTYQYTVQFNAEQQSGSLDVTGNFDMKNGSTVLGDRVFFNIDASVATDQFYISSQRIFVATSTTAVIDFIVENNVYIRSGEAIIKELNSYENTTAWT